MGRPAARALKDIGAHTGLIITGSINVYIGGGPAARKGDAVACPLHGVASITEGSSSVFINGMPAARMGDKTSCGTPPIPAPQGPTQAPDMISHATMVQNANDDGTAKTDYPDNLSIRAMDAYAGLKDRTGDGSYDQAVAGFAMTDFQAKGDWKPLGGEYGGIGASGGFSVVKADALAGAYGSNGTYGAEASANASVVSGNAEVHIGKEGTFYNSAEAEGEVLHAQAEAKGEAYWGGDSRKWGFDGSIGAEAELATGTLSLENENTFVRTKVDFGASAGAVGARANLGFYAAKDDYSLNLKVGGKLALLLGLKADVELSVKFKPFVDLYNLIFSSDSDSDSDSAPAPTVIEGTILTGCFTVLID